MVLSLMKSLCLGFSTKTDRYKQSLKGPQASNFIPLFSSLQYYEMHSALKLYSIVALKNKIRVMDLFFFKLHPSTIIILIILHPTSC